jgi:hypothetical protein
MDGKDVLRNIGFEENYAVDEKSEKFLRISQITGIRSIHQPMTGNPIHCIILNCDTVDVPINVTFVKTSGNSTITFNKMFVFFPTATFLVDLTDIQISTPSPTEIIVKSTLFNLQSST